MNEQQIEGSDGRPLNERLRAFGCPETIRLDGPLSQPSQLEYLDLLPARGSQATVHAVAEHQGAPLLYVLDVSSQALAGASEIHQLQRQLANRSDPAWIGVARPGSLEIYPTGFHPLPIPTAIAESREDSPSAPLFFQSLVHGNFEGSERLGSADDVFKRIDGLLRLTLEEFGPANEQPAVVEPLAILSMAGRALFFRFLVDRRIVRESELPEICPAAESLKECFRDALCAAMTSAWLDDTFNGDFLPLIAETGPADRATRLEGYSMFYKGLEKRAGCRFFDHLHAILNGWQAVGRRFQLTLDWGDLDFAHIPVGVLSQVYESFSHRADRAIARNQSVHYTPRYIAQLMVDEVFAAAPDAKAAKVLDPACGAGIFLVLVFRRLVRERWKADGKRPDTRTIQEILYGQLHGFDLSESALRLAALSLYITAIEINGTQRPPRALRFPRDLRNSVLFRFGDQEVEGPKRDSADYTKLPLGSLGPAVPQALNGSFDMVIGNPPWTRLRESEPQSTAEKLANQKGRQTVSDAMNREFTAIGRRVLTSRGLDDLATSYQNPDKNPDLPFLWRAAEWAKPGEGRIAFALPARIFGRITGRGLDAWKAVLGCFSVTGLISGNDLRKTAVWESIDMPFCLLFARNEPAPRDHRFYFSAPKYEPLKNRHARFRIDYESTHPVRVERVAENPWMLKALSLGTWRDVAVMQRIFEAFPRSLDEVWKAWDPKKIQTGKGYDRSPGLRQKPAPFLGKLLDFEPYEDEFGIRFSQLETYLEKHGLEDRDGIRRASAYRPKTEEIYQPPLVIVPKAPGERPRSPKAYLARRSLAFSQSYYGFCCKGHPEEEALASLLFLVAHSKLLRYFTLMSSVSQGADHMIFTKRDLDRLPFPMVEELERGSKVRICDLARRLELDQEKPWDEIDSTIFSLYGLEKEGGQVVDDTLFSAVSYRRQGRAALERASRQHRTPFRTELEKILQPFFGVCGEAAVVGELAEQPDARDQPWLFLTVARASRPPKVDVGVLRQAMAEANRRSASRIFVQVPEEGGLLLGVLNQRRWWTVTRARLCGQHILRHHLVAFGLD